MFTIKPGIVFYMSIKIPFKNVYRSGKGGGDTGDNDLLTRFKFLLNFYYASIMQRRY